LLLFIQPTVTCLALLNSFFSLFISLFYSSSLTAAANANTAVNGSTKSPQTKDWNQKLFGSKQNKG
jgi:hypothetical protein